jgi:hypothetical protein
MEDGPFAPRHHRPARAEGEVGGATSGRRRSPLRRNRLGFVFLQTDSAVDDEVVADSALVQRRRLAVPLDPAVLDEPRRQRHEARPAVEVEAKSQYTDSSLQLCPTETAIRPITALVEF